MTERKSPLTGEVYPLMPLKDLVVFPGVVAPLIVGRKRSIKALEEAMEHGRLVFLVAQKEPKTDNPSQDDLHTMGTLASVMQLLRLPDGTLKALVEGEKRAKMVGALQGGQDEDSYFSVQLEDCSLEPESGDMAELLLRELRSGFEQYAKTSKKVPPEVLASLTEQDSPDKMADLITSHLVLKTSEKQEILELLPLEGRVSRVLEILYREIELFQLEKEINAKVKKKLGATQRNYYLNEKVKAIQDEMESGADGDEFSEIEQSLEKKRLPALVKEKVKKEYKKLRQMPAMSAETTVVRNYIDTILDLPWREKTRGKINIEKAEAILNEDHYGLEKPKERILEYLAVQMQTNKVKGPVLCLVGPPGVGKTSICKSIARAMGRKFVRLSLGGVRDEAEIRGHRRTYIGAMPGKIIQSMQKAKVINPVFCLDEIDKMSVDFRGDPSAALLEVLDPEQNDSFNDHYLDADYDLSQVFFITTANSLDGIPAPLRDRMEMIFLRGYTEEDKKTIGADFLVPKQLEMNGFQPDDIRITDGALGEIIRLYTREAGVRSLERAIAGVCRKVARERLKEKGKGKGAKGQKQYKIGAQAVEKYLGVAKYRYGLAEKEHAIGLATGMAWTEVGGDLLQIETTVMPGAGKMQITGKLGSVMQESAQAAMSYVRSRAIRLGLQADFYQKIDIHVHVPEGAIPKDGPSAGITIATSIISAILKLPVRNSLAMTGEITLRGRVLPIGGLTEKILAAKRGGIETVLVPAENKRNLKEVPEKVRRGLNIFLVENVDQVLEHAFVLEEGQALFQDISPEKVVSDFTLSAHNMYAGGSGEVGIEDGK